MVHTTGWLKGLQVTVDGTGIVSHAGVMLVRALADNTVYRFRTLRAACELEFGKVDVVRQDRGLCLSACCI